MIKKKNATIKAIVTFKPPFCGGRISMPEGDGYAPYFRSESMGEELAVRLLNIPDDVKFNVPFSVDLELLYYPGMCYGELCERESFYLKEGSKIIAEGFLVSGLIVS